MYETELDLPLVHAGKVRELYAVGDDRLLMVATDNISAFDHVLPGVIPDKGKILNQLSLWWFQQVGVVVDNHVLSTEVPLPVVGRAVICERLEMIPVECVARGYLTGSGWVEYQRSGSVCGVALPAGLVDGSRLPEPIFTPATKAAVGEHDENVSFEVIADTIGSELAAEIRGLTLKVYAHAESIARGRGLILADTKFEFGRRADGTVILADEVLTPDSSRFWDAGTWAPGGRLDSFDKQYVRNWLMRESGWDKDDPEAGPPPVLPEHVVTATREKYADAYLRLTGTPFVA